MGHEHAGREQGGRLPSIWFILVAVMIVGFYLMTEHQAHVFGVLPWLFLLAVPLCCVLMHAGGHGGHGDRDDHQTFGRKEGQPS